MRALCIKSLSSEMFYMQRLRAACTEYDKSAHCSLPGQYKDNKADSHKSDHTARISGKFKMFQLPIPGDSVSCEAAHCYLCFPMQN